MADKSLAGKVILAADSDKNLLKVSESDWDDSDRSDIIGGCFWPDRNDLDFSVALRHVHCLPYD